MRCRADLNSGDQRIDPSQAFETGKIAVGRTQVQTVFDCERGQMSVGNQFCSAAQPY